MTAKLSRSDRAETSMIPRARVPIWLLVSFLAIGLVLAVFPAGVTLGEDSPPAAPPASGPGGWPTSGGGPARNPFVEANLSRALFPRWSFSLDEVSWAAPVVSDGTVYAGTDSGAVLAVDARTGAERWRFTSGANGWSKVRALTASGDTLFAVGSVRDQTGFLEQTGAIYALDAANGTPRWRFDLGEQTFSSPAVAGGAVIVGANDGWVVAVEASTGKEKWRKRVSLPGGGWNSVRSSAAVSGETAVVAAYDGTVYAFDAVDGRQLWRVAVGGYFEPNSAPVVSGDTVYVASSQDQSGAVAAINLPSGELRWKYQAPDQDNLWMNPVVFGGRVIVPNQGAIYVLDAGNGSLISGVDADLSGPRAHLPPESGDRGRRKGSGLHPGQLPPARGPAGDLRRGRRHRPR